MNGESSPGRAQDPERLPHDEGAATEPSSASKVDGWVKRVAQLAESGSDSGSESPDQQEVAAPVSARGTAGTPRGWATRVAALLTPRSGQNTPRVAEAAAQEEGDNSPHDCAASQSAEANEIPQSAQANELPRTAEDPVSSPAAPIPRGMSKLDRWKKRVAANPVSSEPAALATSSGGPAKAAGRAGGTKLERWKRRVAENPVPSEAAGERESQGGLEGWLEGVRVGLSEGLSGVRDGLVTRPLSGIKKGLDEMLASALPPPARRSGQRSCVCLAGMCLGGRHAACVLL